MYTPFTIDIWSDVVCPFCSLGTQQLRRALNQFEHANQAVVRRHAFELDRHAAPSSDLSLDELLATKYSMTVERARTLNERMEREAASYDMTWHLAQARPTNTFDAHRLIALATSQGKGEEMSDRLFRAYFSEGGLLSDLARLDEFASSVGVINSSRLWSGDEYAASVREDEELALELGITGVPSYVIDNKFMIVGAQGDEQILQVLRRAWQRRETQSTDSAGTTAAVATE